MASYYSGWVATDDWRIRADVSVSTSNTAATYTVALYLENRYANVRNTPFYGSVTIAGTASNWNRTGVYPGNTYHLGTATKTVNKGTISQTVAISFRGYFGSGSSSAAYRNGTSGTANQTLAAKPSYTVSYNANGGSGAPGNQTKWYGETLKLSSTKPSRTGYSFQGWATSSGGSVAYASGASYTGNAALTLYAVWKANTYAVKYNANGGSGAPGQQTKTYGVTLKLSSTKPTRTNYNFKGWATSATGAAAYQPGANYTANAAVTLYAVWEIAYIAPTVTNVAVDRCNSAGTITDDGTYLKVSFSYKLDSTYSGGMDYVQLGYKLSSAGSYTNLSKYTPTAMSGSFSQVIGGGLIDTEYPYDVQIIVKDHKGSSTVTRSVGAMSYIIDFSPQGGVGVGTPAPNSKEFQVATPLITTTRLTGFMKRGYHGNNTTWYWKTLAQAQVTTSDLGGGGSITVRGVLGGYGGSTSGTVEITVAIREPSAATVIVDKFGPALFNNGFAAIIFKIDSSGYLTLYLATCGYYSYNLFVEADSQVDIIDSAWFTGEPAGTTLINTRYVKTDQFGGYPAKLEKLNGYFGFALPDKTRTEWLRTTSYGLIPYQSGGASSLGTSTWPFNSLYVKNAYINGEAALHGPSVTATLSTNGTGGYVRYSVYGDIVVVNVDYYKCTANTTIKAGYIPAAYRPKKEVIGFGYVRGTSTDGQISVGTDGGVGIWCTSTNSSYFAGSVAYTLL